MLNYIWITFYQIKSWLECIQHIEQQGWEGQLAGVPLCQSIGARGPTSYTVILECIYLCVKMKNILIMCEFIVIDDCFLYARLNWYEDLTAQKKILYRKRYDGLRSVALLYDSTWTSSASTAQAPTLEWACQLQQINLSVSMKCVTLCWWRSGYYHHSSYQQDSNFWTLKQT